MPFASFVAQGVYNALLALRASGLHERMLDYRPPFYSGDSTVLKPPIWITLVGENARFVPLAHFTNYEDHDLVYAAGTPRPTTPPDAPHHTPPQLGPIRGLPLGLLVVLFAPMVLWIRQPRREGSSGWNSRLKHALFKSE